MLKWNRFSDIHNSNMHLLLTAKRKHIFCNVLGEAGRKILQNWIGEQPVGTQVALMGTVPVHSIEGHK